MRCYAIQDKSTELFVDRNYKLSELGADTLLFKRKEDADSKLYRTLDTGLEYSPILEGLTWAALEVMKGMRREFIDISYKEYHSVRDSFDLEVVRINVSKSKVQEKTN